MAIEVTQPTPGEPPLHLEVSDLPRPDTGQVTAIVQRSTDGGIRWLTVRGLAEAPVPPPPGLHLPGERDSYASTPDDATLDITGDIDIRVEWIPGTDDGPIVAKASYDTDEVSWALWWDEDIAILEWSPDGTLDALMYVESPSVPFLAAFERGALRVTLQVDDDNGNHVVTWYTRPTVDGPWTPLDDPQVEAGTTSIYVSTHPLTVGGLADEGADASGVVRAVKVLDGIDGTPVVDVRFDEQPSGAASFEDAAGREWTVHGDAQILIEPQISVKDWESRPGVTNTYRVGLGQILDRFAGAGDDPDQSTTDTGQTWDGLTFVGSDVSAERDGELRVEFGSPGAEYWMFLQEPTDIGDVDQSIVFSVSEDHVTSSSDVFPSYIGLSARREVGTANQCSALAFFNPDDSVHLSVQAARADNPSAFIEQVALFEHTDAETRYRLRMQLRGRRVRAKLWRLDVEPEPDWQVDVQVPDDRIPMAGRIGLMCSRDENNLDDDLTWTVDEYVADIDQPQWIGSTATITPTLSRPWLCSTMRSFLNRPITIRSYQEPSRAARGGMTAINHRTLPIAQVELSGGREWPLEIRAADLAEARAIEWLVASGDVLWLLVPHGSPVPGGYYRAGQLDARHHRQQGATRWLTLPLTEVAAPGPDVVTAQSTVDTVLALYGTVEDLLAQVPTVEALLDLVGDPAEVVVDQ